MVLITKKRSKERLTLVPVVRKMDSAIHRVDHYPLDSAIGCPNSYPLDSDLYGG